MNRKSVLVLLLSILGCFIGTSLNAGAPPIPRDQWVKEWQRAKAFTEEYLAAMPEEGYAFKPTPEIRSFAGQMLHLATDNYVFGATLSGKKNPYEGKNLEDFPELNTKAAVMKSVMDSYDFMINAVSGLSDVQLGENIQAFGGTMSRELTMAKGFEHQTHHRGQTTIYLRLKGVTPPNEKLF